MVNPRAVAIANAARADLIDRVGGARVRVGTPARETVGLPSDDRGEPVAVVRPAGAEDVVTVLKVGRSRHFEVVVRSRLPAIDAASLRDVIVLDTRGLDRTPAVDIGRRVVTAGAGVAATAIDRAARGARLCLRASPAFDDGATIGALLASGDPGEIGTGTGSLHSDVVAATIVSGSGRIARIGGPLLIGQAPWASGGLPNPLGLLLGSEGQLAVLVDVTLRLHPAPFAAWATGSVGGDRAAFLALLSAVRKATSRQLVDTVLVDAAGVVSVRAATLRSEEDRDALTAQATAAFARHGVKLGSWRPEERRARLGYDQGEWPQTTPRSGPSISLHLSWPDVAVLYDLIAALTHVDGAAATTTTWALGADGVRVRCACDGPAARHPLVQGGKHLFEAGAVPLGAGAALREFGRARMAPSTRILTTALGRAFDPDAVLAAKRGLL